MTQATDLDSSVQPVRRVCCIGAGHVGGSSTSVLALHNPLIEFHVVDISKARIDQWKSCSLPIHEPELLEVVRIARDGAKYIPTCSRDERCWPLVRNPNLFFSNDLVFNIRRADIIFVAVDTPTKTVGIGSGRATDMTAFDTCMNEVVHHAKSGAIIVEKSTVPCGTAQSILSKLHVGRPGVQFEVLSNPEFMSEGTAISDLIEPDRVIIGSFPTPSGQAAAKQLIRLYSWLPNERILTSDVWSSELSKLVANAMLAQRISNINSISEICESTGADIDEIARVVGRDARIGSKFLQSGLGFGGSCLRKDTASLAYIAESLGLCDVADYWTQVNTMNVRQRTRFTNRVLENLGNNLAGKKLTILGFSFKPRTTDVRESITADIVRMLLEECPSEIAIYDPYCRKEDIVLEINQNDSNPAIVEQIIKVYNSPYLACAATDAILITSDCNQFFMTKSNTRRSSQGSKEPPSRTSVFDCPSMSNNIDRTTEHFTCKYQGRMQTFQLLRSPPCTSLEDFCTCRAPYQQDKTATTADDHLDWTSIICSANQPTLIFDGRHVLERDQVQKLATELGRIVVFESMGVRSTKTY